MRALLLWLLILALPVYGASSSSLRLLGPAHWHSAPAVAAASDDWLQPVVRFVQRLTDRVQQLRDDAHLRAHAHGHPHEHHGLQRHWHDASDGGVHTVDGAGPGVADLVASASVGSATLTLAAHVPPMLVPSTRANGRWPPTLATAWADAEPRHTSPPPRR